MSYLSKISQNVVADTNNSSIENLASQAMFTGTKSSTLGIVGIQISLYADQNCAVYVDQSPDGDDWDLVDTFFYTALSKSFGLTVQAINSYVRVRVINRGTSTTQTFRLQTALCPIVEAVPRTLDENGNFRNASPVDKNNFNSENTPQGETRIAEKNRLVGAQFDGEILDGNYWLSSAGTGTIGQSGTEVTLTSGTADGHYAKLYSVRRGRYIGGQANIFRCHIRVGDTGTANVKRRWGIAYGATMPTITDGAYFELNGTTFSIVTFKGGNETRVSSGAFNGHLDATYTPTTLNTVYEILYNNSGVWFYIGGELLHKVTASAATWSNTLNHYIYIDVTNSGNSAAVPMYCRVATISRFGNLTSAPKYYNLSGNATTHTLKLGAGIIHKIIFNNTSGTSFIIYDSTTGGGSKIGSVTTTSSALGDWNYDCPFLMGWLL